jgi:GR25 family glycosyltransferase involved in LPS biosynthesis
MKAFIIRIKDDIASEKAAKALVESCPDKHIEFRMFDAITPNLVDIVMSHVNLKWNYPWTGNQMDFRSGLLKSAYPTAVPNKRIGCFLSHYKLWQSCVAYDEPIIIHEHDAFYLDKLPVKDLRKSRYDIIGFNSPFGATRRSSDYHDVVINSTDDDCGVVRAPKIDADNIPQGIAGNSSYYIKPKGAQKLIDLAIYYGAWPNDALMCRQLISTLGQTKKYYATTQNLESTTSL